MLAPGSSWRRWDLHVHTPESALNNQFGSWESYLAKLESFDRGLVSVVGITDYFSIDGYKKILTERGKGNLAKFDLVIPNIEFRISPSTRSGKGINVHLLVSPDDPNHVSEIESALTRLFFEYNHQRYSCSKPDLTKLGKAVKSGERLSSEAAFKEGVNQFKPSLDTFREWYEHESWLKGNSLIVAANGHHDGASGIQDSGMTAVRNELYRLSDLIFSSNPKDRTYFLGKAADSEGSLIEKYGGLKPCIHGSDAHSEDRIFKPDQNRFCWIKADPTFEGLRQLKFEPEDRVYIGETRPNNKDSRRVLIGITISNSNGWFSETRIPLNENMVSVIGSRGSGKTALADLIAYGTGSWGEVGDSSFLKKARSELVGTKIVTEWANGDKDEATIGRTLATGTDQSVCYLSQQFVERLCSEDLRSTELLQQVERVIFEHVPETEKLGQSSFEDLRTLLTKSTVDGRRDAQQQIARLNGIISGHKTEIAQLPNLRQQLSSYQAEREGLVTQTPILSNGSEEEQGKVLKALEKQLQSLELSVTGLKQRHIRIRQTQRKVEAFQQDLGTFVDEIRQEIENLDIRYEPINTDIFKDVIASLTSAESDIITKIARDEGQDGDRYPETVSIRALATEISKQRSALSMEEAKKQRFLTFQDQLKALETKIAQSEEKISQIQEDVQLSYDNSLKDRRAKFCGYVDLLSEESKELEKLYGYLRQAYGEDSLIEHKLEFYIRRVVDVETWCRKGEDLIDQRRTGPFRAKGRLAEKAYEVLSEVWDFGPGEDILNKLQAFRTIFESQEGVTLASQLKPGITEAAFDDWLFDPSVIQLTYGIKYDGIELENLSPGTRGVALLILYLGLDRKDTRPLLIDQPEENLDNESIYTVLTPYFRKAKNRRQIILITHNPNLVVNTDSEQVVVAEFSKTPPENASRINYVSGGLEDSNANDVPPGIRERVCNILEGGQMAFARREKRYSFR